MLIMTHEADAACVWGQWSDSRGNHFCPPDCGGNPECGSTGSPSPPPVNQDRIDEREANNEGNARYNANDYSGAITAYLEALGYCHTDCDYLHKNIAYAQRNLESDRASILWNQKDYVGAIAAYQSALQYCRSDMDCGYLHRNISTARHNISIVKGNQARKRGTRLSGQGDYAGAITSFEEALQYCSGDEACIHNTQMAIDDAKESRALDRGHRLRKQGDYDGAIAAYKEAIAYSGFGYNRITFVDMIADIQIEQGDYDGAIATYEYARRHSDPGIREIYRDKPDYVRRKKDELDRKAHLREQKKRWKKGDDANKLGNKLFDQKRYEEAESAYRNGLQHDPDDHILHYNLSLSLERQGRYLEAEEVARQAVLLAPSYKAAKKQLKELRRHNAISDSLGPLGPVLTPVLEPFVEIGALLNDKRNNLGSSLRDDYTSVLEQASSVKTHSGRSRGGSKESAKEQSNIGFDTKGENVGTSITPLVVDGRPSDQPDEVPEAALLNDQVWLALDKREKKLQAKFDAKEKVLDNLHEMRADPKISTVKKAMIMVAIANKKQEAINIKQKINMTKYEKRKRRKQYKLGAIKERKNDDSSKAISDGRQQ